MNLNVDIEGGSSSSANTPRGVKTNGNAAPVNFTWRTRKPILNLGLTVWQVVQSAYSLSASSTRSSEYCPNPLATWLLVTGITGIVAGTILFVLVLWRIYLELNLAKSGIDPLKAPRKSFPRIYNLSWLAMGLLFLFQLGWVIPGSIWLWGTNTTSCSSALWNDAHGVLITQYAVFGAVILLGVRGAIKGRQQTS